MASAARAQATSSPARDAGYGGGRSSRSGEADAVEGLFAAGYSAWMRARAAYLGPALQFLTNACVVLFMIQSADRLILCLGYFWIKLRGIKPVVNTTAASGKGSDDVEAGAQEEDFPMVLVQEVYQQSIGAISNLDWPRSNFLVQVLDASDDAATSALIKEEVCNYAYGT